MILIVINYNNRNKKFNEAKIEKTAHAHGGGKFVYLKLDKDLGANSQTAIVRMTFKEAQTLRKRTPVLS